MLPIVLLSFVYRSAFPYKFSLENYWFGEGKKRGKRSTGYNLCLGSEWTLISFQKERMMPLFNKGLTFHAVFLQPVIDIRLSCCGVERE